MLNVTDLAGLAGVFGSIDAESLQILTMVLSILKLVLFVLVVRLLYSVPNRLSEIEEDTQKIAEQLAFLNQALDEMTRTISKRIDTTGQEKGDTVTEEQEAAVTQACPSGLKSEDPAAQVPPQGQE